MQPMPSTPGYLDRRFIALAHRGGAMLAQNLGIENTLKAFGNAHALGFDYLETDVHLTKDGRLIAFHDDDLARVAGRTGRIRDLTFSELRDIRIGFRAQIPTFTELLEALPNARFNVDLKAPGTGPALAGIIKKQGAEDRVCVGSFSLRRIREFRRLMPFVVTAADPVEVAALAAGRVSRSRTAAPSVFQVPLTHKVGPTTVTVLTKERVEAIHHVGRKVHVWTIDDPDVMHRLIDWGVDGIVSDRPDLLKRVLSDRGMWSTRHGT